MVSPKVVLDTNILISALGWDGKPREIFLKCITGELEFVISTDQLQEVMRVLQYPKFNFSDDKRKLFVEILLDVAAVVEIDGRITAVRDDPDDNVILETAIAGGATYIISGDDHLLSLKEFKGIKIVTASDFLMVR